MKLRWLLKDPWAWVHGLGCYCITTIALRMGMSRLESFGAILAIAVLWEIWIDDWKLIPQLADPRGWDAWDVVVSMIGIAGAIVIWLY